jgi:hypothetical protein
MSENDFTPERRFCLDVLWMAVHPNGYGGLALERAVYGTALAGTEDEYEYVKEAYLVDADDPSWEDPKLAPKPLRVTSETIAEGLMRILSSKPDEANATLPPYKAYVYGLDGRELHMTVKHRADILAAAGLEPPGEPESANIDVVDALAILECGLFGRVVY